MACEYDEDLTDVCDEYAVGGVNRVVIYNISNLSAPVLVASGATKGALESITRESGSQGYEIPIKAYSGGATDSLQNADIGNQGSKNFLHGVLLKLQGSTQQKTRAIEKLGLARVVAFVESRSVSPLGGNRWFVMGLYNGLQLTKAEGGLAQNVGDLSGYDVELMQNEVTGKIEVVPAAGTPTAFVEALLIAAP